MADSQHLFAAADRGNLQGILCIEGEKGSGRTFCMEQICAMQELSLLLIDAETFCGNARELYAYGGYDGYTEETGMDYVSGMLRTRNRAVTGRDFLELIRQTAYGIRKVKCCNHTDASGRRSAKEITIAILTEEYEKGSHVFYEIKRKIMDRLKKDSALYPLGREISLIQPHFVKLNVRVWLEKENLDQAYDLQVRAKEMIERFIDPLNGGQGMQGWEIGEFPGSSQIIAYLRTGILGCNISKILMTAEIDGKEVPVDESFHKNNRNPFLMAVNGEHVVYIEVNEC